MIFLVQCIVKFLFYERLFIVCWNNQANLGVIVIIESYTPTFREPSSPCVSIVGKWHREVNY